MKISTTIKPLGIKAKRLFTELAKARNWTLRPNGYSGRGRYASKTANHAGTLANTLEGIGLVRGQHFTTGNDAPRGGWSGEFVTLLPAGRRLKVVTDIRHAEAPAPAPAPTAPAPTLALLTSSERKELDAWYLNGEVHPCPKEVFEVKQKSLLSWQQITHALALLS